MSRMNRVATALAVAVFAGLGPAAFSGTIRHDVNDQAYQDLAASSAYASVGRIVGSDAGGGYYASGTLIADRWVLTAAHVTSGATSLNFSVGGQTYSGTRWISHPNWNGSLSSGYDIGLIELASAPGITPAQRYTGSSELGKLGTFVGYGATGTGLTGYATYDGLKRAGQNTLDVFFRTGGKTSRLLGVDFDSPAGNTNRFGSAAALSLEYLISFGDSGGGVFIQDAGKTLLAGVHSFISDANFSSLYGDYGDYTGHTRVSQFNKWINDVLAGITSGGKGKGKSAQFAVATVPEPASIILLLLLPAGLLQRRRR